MRPLLVWKHKTIPGIIGTVNRRTEYQVSSSAMSAPESYWSMSCDRGLHCRDEFT